MKKKIILLLCLMMCGCSAVYNLEIRDGSFYENIELEYLESENIIGTELYEQLSNLKNDAIISPFEDGSDDEKYDITFMNGDNQSKVNLQYKFNQTSFFQSYLLNNCFEKNDSIYDDIYYVISVNGRFTCNYVGDFKIKIRTNHKVIDNNADEIIGNHTYIWNVKNNKENNLYIKMYRNKKNMNWALIISIIFIISILLVFMIKIIKKLRFKDNL